MDRERRREADDREVHAEENWDGKKCDVISWE